MDPTQKPEIRLYREEGDEAPAERPMDDETIAFQYLLEAERRAGETLTKSHRDTPLSPHSHIRALILSSDQMDDLELLIDIFRDSEDSLRLIDEFIIRVADKMPADLVGKLFASMLPDDFVTHYQELPKDPLLGKETLSELPAAAAHWIGPQFVLSVLERSHFAELNAGQRGELSRAFGEVIKIVNEADLSQDSAIALKMTLSGAFFKALNRKFVSDAKLKISPTG